LQKPQDDCVVGHVIQECKIRNQNIWEELKTVMQIIANIFTALGHIIDAVAGFKFNEKDKIML
jgi:hypothetical protein